MGSTNSRKYGKNCGCLIFGQQKKEIFTSIFKMTLTNTSKLRQKLMRFVFFINVEKGLAFCMHGYNLHLFYYTALYLTHNTSVPHS